MRKSAGLAISLGLPAGSNIMAAWAATLLVSPLSDITFYELTGAVPGWLLPAKLVLLSALILASRLSRPLKALNHFFLMLLAITALLSAHQWLLELPAWTAWQKGKPFAAAAIGVQALEMMPALLLTGLLFLLRGKRSRFFLVRGDKNALAEPVRWLGHKKPGPLWSFGLVFTLIVMAGQFFMFILPNWPDSAVPPELLPLVPVILLLAASNGFNEEIILRVAPIATVFEVVGKNHAIWMAAVLFGLSHYLGGIPSGIPGVLITTFLGWFFGKCLLDSRGFFWPWFFHALQDILPFTMMALAAVS